jgi:hypothetical protein
MDEASGFRAAPTDQQIERSPLLTVGVSADVRALNPSEWSAFADRRTNPVPEAFREAIAGSLDDLLGQSRLTALVSIEEVDRPPRASPLFAQYFIDLSELLSDLADVLPREVLSGLVGVLINRNVLRMEATIFPSRKEGLSLQASYSPVTLELLCENFVHVHRPGAAITHIDRKPYNTRVEYGYTYPVDESQPTGWIITVTADEDHFEFTVDGNAHVLRLDVLRNGQRLTVENPSIVSPELADMTLQRIKPWFGVADADSIP